MKNLYLKLLSLLVIQAFAYQTAHAVMVQVGTLGTTTTSTTYTPYKTLWEDGRTQYLILASEIISNGGSAGQINSLAFNVSTAQAQVLNGFTIKMGSTALTSLTNTFQPNGGFTTCYTSNVPGTTIGWNTYMFSNGFNWNGIDNIIVEVCFDNASWTSNSGIHYNTLAFNSNTQVNADGQVGCSMAATGVYTQRPVMQLNILPPVADDAGIAIIESPTVPACNLLNVPILITMDNSGSDTLFTATVNWWVNGIPQTPYNFSDTILPYSSKTGVNIGTYTFNNNDFLAIKTTLPNGVIDLYNVNDSLDVIVATGLSGSYTISSGGDYPTFNDAVNDLNAFGVCGPTVFLVDNTTFNEQVILGYVNGTDSINTITFRGTGNNSKLIYNSTGTLDNYVIRFNNGDYYRIDSLTIENTGLTYSYVIELLNGSSNNEITNCTLRNDTNTTTTSTLKSIVYGIGSANTDNNNLYKNNLMQGGSVAFYLRGQSTSNLADGNVIEGNTFYKQYYQQAYLYYQRNIKVRDNKMNMLASYTGTTYSLYMWYCYDKMEITGNILTIKKPIGIHYSMYLGQCIGLNNKKGLIANNFIATTDTNNLSGTYGIYSTGNTYTDIVHNNFNLAHNTTGACGIYLTGGGNANVLNNSLVLRKMGYGLYVASVGSINNSNHNNLYVPNGNVGYYNGVIQTTLNNWINNTGFDANSISVDPMYIDTFNLHTCEVGFVGSGINIANVTEDIDGEQRDSNKPYIGADVFFDLSADLLGAEVSKCPQDAITLEVQGDSTQILSYNWTPGNLTTPSISVNNAGWYYVTITTACGSATDSIEVINKPLPIASFNITTTNQLTAVFADASTNATSWTWNFGDGNSSTQQNPFHIYNQSGTYTVTLIACNDCGCDTTTQVVTVLANSIDENFLQNVVSIYPNPNKGEFTISMNGVASAQIEITTIQGQVVYTEKVIANGSINKNIHLNNATGMYFVKIIANEQTMISKVIVE